MERTLTKDTVKNIGKKVKLLGWAGAIRDHGKITFVDLRDRSGQVQCVGSKLPKLSAESVVEIRGMVQKRPKGLINKNLETGTIEVKISNLTLLAKAKELPLPLESDGLEIEETVRLKYRYLDLRRARLTRNLKLRHRTTQFIRNWLAERDFIEIETPVLTKTTPEGARDFIVPSRLQPGKFYALPQSPQQYKQLLMVAGFERYFQIARCFRDEDPRADRAYGEFTQLDLEMSFVTQEDILKLIEELFTELVREVFPDKKITKTPWPRIQHSKALKKYGNDKPDLRINKKDADELAFAWVVGFPLFIEQKEKDYFHGSGSATFAPSHHMFTAPHPDDLALLDKEPMKVRSLQHDMVLNGYEVGGGSIRIHQADIQEKVFDLIGFTKAQKKQFQHILTAFKYGVPPHGGIASGIDRILMAVMGEPSLREFIAFPMNSSGITSVLDAPSEAAKKQLKELGIKAKKE